VAARYNDHRKHPNQEVAKTTNSSVPATRACHSPMNAFKVVWSPSQLAAITLTAWSFHLVVRFDNAPIVRQNFSKMDGMQPISSQDPILTKGAVLGGHGSIGCSLILFYHAYETAHIHQLGTSPAPDDQCRNPFVAKDDQHWKPAQDTFTAMSICATE
jgi:hypothetical protein